MTPAAKLVGFLLLLVVIFAGARFAGARLGPVDPGTAKVQCTGACGGGAGMSGMTGMSQ
ncbi:MAG TPA: hypothetical protein VK817_07885 [Trebonia sp.]|nr:hypothetical protein [Trebonia sp.]